MVCAVPAAMFDKEVQTVVRLSCIPEERQQEREPTNPPRDFACR
jgi:hypothetical protein